MEIVKSEYSNIYRTPSGRGTLIIDDLYLFLTFAIYIIHQIVPISYSAETQLRGGGRAKRANAPGVKMLEDINIIETSQNLFFVFMPSG